jgi:hypothetical protein
MAKKRMHQKRRATWKTVLRRSDLDQAKSAVLNSLSSTEAQRGYRHAMDEFIEWYCSEPRLTECGFTASMSFASEGTLRVVRFRILRLSGICLQE